MKHHTTTFLSTEKTKIRKWPLVWARMKVTFKLAILILGFIASVAGYLSLRSNIYVEAKPPLKSGDLASSPMWISNLGLVSIHDVSYICKVIEIKTQKGGKFIAYEKGVRPTGFIISELEKGETATVGLPFTFIADPISYADFEFVVTYRPFSLWPFTVKKPFRFTSAVNDKGEIFLLPRSTSER